MLMVPYKFLFPSALFFICIGVFADKNSLFDVGVTLFFGIFGYLLLMLKFEPAPILLGFVLGPRFEENFRRALIISRGDMNTFVDRWISATFLSFCVILVGGQLFVRLRNKWATGAYIVAAITLALVAYLNLYVFGLCLVALAVQFALGLRAKKPMATADAQPARVAGE